MTDDSRLNELEPYLPSSSEKKQAVMMYMVVGLNLSMGKWEVSPFTHHHIKQSLGWLVSLVLMIFADIVLIVIGFMFAAISGLIFSFFSFIAFLITVPVLIVGGMGIYQATKGKYIWESEFMNKFFAFFSGIGNWVLNLFGANNYKIIDAERYRTEEQFYEKEEKKEEKLDDSVDNTQQTTQNLDDLNSQTQSPNDSISDGKTLDNNQQNIINNQNIGIDLSGHEINNPENQINN